MLGDRQGGVEQRPVQWLCELGLKTVCISDVHSVTTLAHTVRLGHYG